MLVDNFNSFNSNFDILSNDDFSLDKKKIYYETTIKKKKKDIYSHLNESDSLLNALRNFSVKFELNDKKILKDYKYVISFDELISLIRFSLESQKKLNNVLEDESQNIKIFTNDFINNISNYIYSYEKVEKVSPISKFSNKIKFSSNKENININTDRTNKTNRVYNKNPPCIIKSSSCWTNMGKTKKKQNKNKTTLNRNFQTNLKSNKSSINKNQTNINTNANINKNINSEETNNNTKSYFRPKNNKKLSNIFSPIKNPSNKDNKIKVIKSRMNKSAEKRHNHKSSYNDYFKNNKENNNKINANKSMEKGKIINSDNKNETKPISIFSAIEYLKSSSFIIKNKNNNVNKIEKKSNYNSNDSMNDIKKEDKDKKVVYYDRNMMLGIRKKIIKANVPKPSNLANKLLEKGIKFITDFNGL